MGKIWTPLFLNFENSNPLFIKERGGGSNYGVSIGYAQNHKQIFLTEITRAKDFHDQFNSLFCNLVFLFFIFRFEFFVWRRALLWTITISLPTGTTIISPLELLDGEGESYGLYFLLSLHVLVQDSANLYN